MKKLTDEIIIQWAIDEKRFRAIERRMRKIESAAIWTAVAVSVTALVVLFNLLLR